MEDFQDEEDESANEIVRCICEMDEENGFMIQVGMCDVLRQSTFTLDYFYLLWKDFRCLFKFQFESDFKLLYYDGPTIGEIICMYFSSSYLRTVIKTSVTFKQCHRKNIIIFQFHI